MAVEFEAKESRCIWLFRPHVWSKWWAGVNMATQYRRCARCNKICSRLI